MTRGGDPILSEESEIPFDLPPPFQVVAYDHLASTNDTAKEFAREGAAHGLTVWARAQSAGRGRQGRVWHSPPGNLYMSVVLRPSIAAIRLGELSFVAAVAIAEAVRSVVSSPALVSLKWPNDVLIDGAKISGILMESEPAASGGVAWVVCGIGVNLCAAPEGLPYPATSLTAFSCEEDSAAILARVIGSLAKVLDLWETGGFGPIRERWRSLGHRAGDQLTIRQGDQTIAGKFLDLDADGSLLIETERGVISIMTGDVASAHTVSH